MSVDKYDVIIVGAGAAGIAAADRLHAQGKRVVILEARDRIGGRVHSLRTKENRIELGAEFIHGLAPATQDWVKRTGSVPVETGGSLWHFNAEAGKLEREELGFPAESPILSQLRNGVGQDQSFHDFLDEHFPKEKFADERLRVIGFVQGFHAADIDRISEFALGKIQNEDERTDYRLPEGYSPILEQIAAPLDIRLGQFVNRVEWRPGHVCAETEKLKIQAPKIVVTIPLSLLKLSLESGSRGIEFVPPLEAKRSCLGRLEMGSAARVLVECNAPFWNSRLGDSDVGFILAFGQTFPVWWTSSPIRSPVLTGWAGGPPAAKLQALSESDLRSQALTSLSKLFAMERAELESHVESIHFHNWQTDPLSRGAYSYIGVGGMGAQKELAESIDDTLFFAGEATAFDGSYSTVEGAIVSGNRAADEILSSKLQNATAQGRNNQA